MKVFGGLWGREVLVAESGFSAALNDRLCSAIEVYDAEQFQTNDAGMRVRVGGVPANIIESLNTNDRAALMALADKAATVFAQTFWGVDAIEDPLFSFSGDIVKTGMVTTPHIDHGCQIVVAYFPRVNLAADEPTMAGDFAVFDGTFASAYDAAGAKKTFLRVSPVTGSVVAFAAPGTVHMHMPTFVEGSKRFVLDAFVSFFPAGRSSRMNSAVKRQPQ